MKRDYEEIYREWVNKEINSARRTAKELEKGYNSLEKKDTTHAQSLKKMAEGHRKCLEIWQGLKEE